MLDLPELFEALLHVLRNVLRRKIQNFQRLVARLEIQGMFSVPVPHEIRDEIPEVHAGGQLFISLGSGGMVVITHPGNQMFGEVPVLQKASAYLGMVDTE